jgi:predicted transcriptional regulator of viral defense system
VYAVQSPLLSAQSHLYVITAALADQMAISERSALAYHGLTAQIPPMVQTSTPSSVVTPEMRAGKAHRPQGHAVWQALELEFEFIKVKAAGYGEIG